MAASLALQAFAQDADPPGRVAYLNHQQGTLSMSPAGDDSWYDIIPNRPLTQGDRLWVDRNGRAEIYVGANALRMDGQTDLAFDELGDQSLRVTVQQGRLQLRVREDLADQRIELGTGNLRMEVRAPGDYRVLVDPAADSTQIMVAQGSVTVYGANGQVQELGSRQQAVFVGRDLAPGGAPQALSDDFERWLAARNQAEERSQSARYVSPEMPGYQQLDAYGQWQTEPGYGAVWYPRQVAPGWAPYSDGYWIVVAPWGLTWVDRAPWGFAPFHYGRWTRIGARWCWVPGQRHVRPVYSPALVAFVGGQPGASFTVRGSQPAVGWFPLAPGDRWRPAYRASDRYIERANRVVIAPRDVPAYANRGIPNAVTAVPANRFGRGPISRRDHVRPPDPRVLNQAQVLPRPPVQLPAVGATTSPGGAAAAMGFAGRRSSAVPPAAIQARQQPEWRQRFEPQGQQQQQREQRDQARSAQRQQELQERAARDQQDAQRRGMQEQQQLRNQQQAQQQQEQARRQAEQQQENAQRQARQQEQQSRRQAEQQEQQSRRQLEQQAQQQEQARRQAEQQQGHAQRQAQQQQQQQEQMRRQAEQQQENAQRQARQQEQQARRQAEQEQQAQQSRRQMEQQAQQQEQARRQAEQQQQQAQRQAQQQQQAQRQAQQQQQEQMRRQAEQQQAQAQRQAQQQQQEQMRRQAEQQQANAQRQAQQQQAQQMQQQQAQRAAQMQAQQQQEQMRRQMEQQQAQAQRQAQQQQQQEQMRRQADQAARQQQQQQQMQQQAEQQARQREQQQRQQQQQQQQAQQQRQRGGGPQSNDPQQQQQRP